jgi:hypothetical protein
MTMDRKDRLRKAVRLQEKLSRLHETRHAMHVSAAHEADGEARDIAARFEAEDSLSGLFPEIYHRRIALANERRVASLANASREAGLLATARMRTDITQREYREALKAFERREEERTQLETVERGVTTPK